MSNLGLLFKRCGCRDGSRWRLENSCPRLSERGHGTVTDDSLYAFWWLTALRGLRRGEM